MLIKIAFRNVLRQKRRSLLTIGAIVAGFAFGSMAIGWRTGTFNMIIDNFARAYLGHIQIHREGYLERPTLYKTLDDYDAIGEKLDELDFVEAWAPRLYAAGLASVGEKSDAIRIIGVDPELETKATSFEGKVESGNVFSKGSSHEVVIGQDLMEAMNAEIGDEMVIVVQAADGSMGNDLYTIVGAAESGNESIDRMGVYMNLPEAQELMVMPGLAHEIVVITRNIKRLEKWTSIIRDRLDNGELEISPWDEVNVNFARMIEAKEQAQGVMQFVIMLIVAIGVLNTVLMSVLERTREFGVLKALGTRPSGVFMLIMTETMIMCVVGIILGIIVGTALNLPLSFHGIKLPMEMDIGGIVMDSFKSEINAQTIVDPAILVFFTALVVSLYPAAKAARTDPAKTMRFH